MIHLSTRSYSLQNLKHLIIQLQQKESVPCPMSREVILDLFNDKKNM